LTDYRRAVLDAGLSGDSGGSGASASNAELVKQMKDIRDDIRMLIKDADKNSKKALKILDKWDGDGLPPERTV